MQYVRATTWSQYAYPSQDGVFEETTGGARIAWCRLEIRSDGTTAKVDVDVDVDVEAEPVSVVADAKVGIGAGEATVKSRCSGTARTDGRVRQGYAITLNGIVPPGRDHLLNLSVYGAEGRPYLEYSGALAFGPEGSYLVTIPSDKTIGRVVLTSYSVQHARFDGVHLWPNP